MAARTSERGLLAHPDVASGLGAAARTVSEGERPGLDALNRRLAASADWTDNNRRLLQDAAMALLNLWVP